MTHTQLELSLDFPYYYESDEDWELSRDRRDLVAQNIRIFNRVYGEYGGEYQARGEVHARYMMQVIEPDDEYCRNYIHRGFDYKETIEFYCPGETPIYL